MSDLELVRMCAAHGKEPAIHVQQYLKPGALPQTIIRCDHGCQIIGYDEASARSMWNMRRAESQFLIHDYLFRRATRDDREAIIPLVRGGVVDDKSEAGCKNKHDNAPQFGRTNPIETPVGKLRSAQRLIDEALVNVLDERDQAIRDRVAMEDERDTARLDAKAAREALGRLAEASRLNQENDHAVQDKLRKERDEAVAELRRTKRDCEGAMNGETILLREAAQNQVNETARALKERDDARAEVERQNAELTELRAKLGEYDKNGVVIQDGKVHVLFNMGGGVMGQPLRPDIVRELLNLIESFRDSHGREIAALRKQLEATESEQGKKGEMKTDLDDSRNRLDLARKRLTTARKAMANLRGLKPDRIRSILADFDAAVASI